MSDSDVQIQAADLADLVDALGSPDHVRECVECLHRIGGKIILGTAVARNELLRVYRRRERGSLLEEGHCCSGGGDGLVKSLAASHAEGVFVVSIMDAIWSGYVFLENSPKK